MKLSKYWWISSVLLLIACNNKESDINNTEKTNIIKENVKQVDTLKNKISIILDSIEASNLSVTDRTDTAIIQVPEEKNDNSDVLDIPDLGVDVIIKVSEKEYLEWRKSDRFKKDSLSSFDLYSMKHKIKYPKADSIIFLQDWDERWDIYIINYEKVQVDWDKDK